MNTLDRAGYEGGADLIALHEKDYRHTPQELFAMPEIASESAHELPATGQGRDQQLTWRMTR